MMIEKVSEGKTLFSTRRRDSTELWNLNWQLHNDRGCSSRKQSALKSQKTQVWCVHVGRHFEALQCSLLSDYDSINALLVQGPRNANLRSAANQKPSIACRQHKFDYSREHWASFSRSNVNSYRSLCNLITLNNTTLTGMNVVAVHNGISMHQENHMKLRKRRFVRMALKNWE